MGWPIRLLLQLGEKTNLNLGEGVSTVFANQIRSKTELDTN